VGGAIGYLATPLALGALWVFIPALLTIVALVVRTVLEDKTLQAELPGYAEYARRTRYRLLPGVW
jgi:protein-S-isoprenylcysteine O-methyltransferase Ste14